MSKYTTEVRFICETYAGEQTSCSEYSKKIDLARPHIFNFSYPLFDESYKSVLETKILKHYYTREIGFETVGLWKLKLDTKLNEILPYYNQLYKSELMEFNPLYTVNLTTDHNKQNAETGSTSGSENTTGKEDGTYTRGVTDETTFAHVGTEQTKGKETNSGTDKTSGTNTTGVNVGSTTTTTDLITGETTSTQSVDGTTSSTTTTHGSTSDKSKDLHSDTPQGGIDGLESSTYLTDATVSIKDGSNTQNTTGSGTNKQTTTTTGSNKQNDTTKVTSSSETDGVDTSSGKTEYGKIIDNTGQTIYDLHDKTDYTSAISDATGKTSSGSKNTTGNSKIDSLEDYIEHVVGYTGVSGSKLLQEFRETFLNIDLMLIEELEPLFLQLW